MSLPLFETLKAYVDFTAADAAVLRDLYPSVASRLPAIVDDFYLRISLHEGIRRLIGGPEQVQRLKGTLSRWLSEVFLGPHDAAYSERRRCIGRKHVEIGLPQAYVFGAMAHIRRQLEALLVEEGPAAASIIGARLAALTKILHLDLALITDAYHEAEKYRDLVEAAPEMIHEVDRQGRFLTVNQTEQKWLGYSREELLEKRLADVVPPEDRGVIEKHLGRVFDRGSNRCEVRLLTASGERIEVEILATSVRDKQTGEVAYTRAYVRDISERKRAEGALRHERDMVKKYLRIAGSIICIVDAEGCFTLMNEKGCEVLGSSEEAIVGQPYERFIPERHREEARAAFRRFLGGDVKALEWHEQPVLNAGGEERSVEWHNTALHDAAGRITGMLSSGVDVTERRRMEKLLIEQASLARLGEMAAVVAHEVKNPLAGISGALQLIVNQLPREGSGRTMVHEILERLNALNNSVDDLLLFARPRLPRLAPVPLLSLVHDTVALLKQDPRLGDIAVETFGEDLIVTGDAELLKPVFLNLFINAAQAMNGKGTITVAVEAIDGRCRVSLKDTGPGIPAQVLERVFEPFFSTKHRGTGLGLPISKRIVEAHGGRISLVSPAGGGTTVSLELPVATRSGG